MAQPVSEPAEQRRELTFGEKAVGLTFNPSNNVAVQTIKVMYAAIIDDLNDRRAAVTDGTNNDREVARMLSVAITDTQTAQMWAVKAVTWGLK